MSGIPWGLDPRTCILCATAFSIVAACLQDMRAASVALTIGIACVAFNKKAWSSAPRKLAAVNAFILFIWLVTPFTTPGNPLWQWGFLQITDSGINLAALASLKANSLACVFIALVAPLPLQYLDNALWRLHCPEKLSWVFLMLEKNISVLKTEWANMSAAAKLRGFSPSASLHGYRTMASMLAILLIRARNRAAHSREALLLKGFNGHFPRIFTLRYGWRDYIFALLAIICTAILVMLEKGFPHG